MCLRLLVSPLVVMSLVLAACGDDDAGGAGDVDVSGLVDDRSDAEVEADVALAEDALLQLSDLPDGWGATEPEADDGASEAEDDETTDQLFQCLDIPEADREVLENERVDVDSDDFDLDDATASSSIGVFPSDQYAAAVFAPFHSPNFEDCFRELTEEEFAKGLESEGEEVPGLEINDISIEPLDFDDRGDDSAAYRLSISATVSDIDFEAHSDFIAFRVGRSLVSLELSNVDAPFDADLAEELADIVEERAGGI